MEIKKKFLDKYLHNIAIEQIAEEYLQKGYEVSKENQIGKYQADIIAKKGDETIVIEIKSGKMTPDKKETITQLGNYIHTQSNYKFIVVIATPPKEKKLEIINIDELLSSYFIEEFPEELNELSTHTMMDEISDIDIDEIRIDGKSIFIKGDGVVSVELQYGSDSDQTSGDGNETSDNFPFEFELTLEYDKNHKLKITDVDKLIVDTSSFYE